MFLITTAIFIRIFSNSYLNVFQKQLTALGEKSSVINFYTYLGLFFIGLFLCPDFYINQTLIINILLMGLLGALGNFFIIKALSCGELSLLAPINSYKPIVALIFGYFLLNEIPNTAEFAGILLIILGSFILGNKKFLISKPLFFRFLALIFSGTEAIFIKKVILLTNITTTFFYWTLTGLIFSAIVAVFAKNSLKIKKENLKTQIALIFTVALMQYSTNYAFSKINVAHALALFQLSSILSIILGVKTFNEKNLLQKLLAATIMLFGATVLILS